MTRALTIKQVRRLLAEGRKVRADLEARIRKMRVPPATAKERAR
jgi:hypothetical protein